jgi:alpha-L-fucosidase
MVFVLGMLNVAMFANAAEPVNMQNRRNELTNLKWGMFVCWSFSTFSGREWTPGVKDVGFFQARECDTDQWARTAKEAGMGYILFLTKHHDGFCLWDTKTTDRKVTKAPLGRDVLAELRKSCDKHAIKLALYFSEGDWTWPGALDGQGGKGGSNPEMKKAQLKELLTKYGPIEYIWFDHAVGDGGLSHKETAAWCKSLQPGCFVGFNHGDQENADIRLGEMGRPGPLSDSRGAGPYMGNAASKSYLLAEFTYPIVPPHEGGAMWFYSLPKHDDLCLSALKLYKDYLGAVKYGNIFSLDVGPDYRGRLRKIDVETLQKVGRLIRNPPPPSPPSLTTGRKATASSTWPQPGYEADKAVDAKPGIGRREFILLWIPQDRELEVVAVSSPHRRCRHEVPAGRLSLAAAGRQVRACTRPGGALRLHHLRALLSAVLLCWTTMSAAQEKPLSGDLVAADNGALVIRPVNHATFVMQWNGKTVYVDPVGGGKPFADLPKPDLVLVTHMHADHFDPATLEAILPAKGKTIVVAPKTVAERIPESLRSKTMVRILANGEKTEAAGVEIQAVPAYNSTPGKEKFHPKGRDNGYVLTMGGKKVYIAGDTEDTAEMRALKGIDIAFLPMNLPYTMSVEKAADAIRQFKPKVVYPYRRWQDVERPVPCRQGEVTPTWGG